MAMDGATLCNYIACVYTCPYMGAHLSVNGSEGISASIQTKQTVQFSDGLKENKIMMDDRSCRNSTRHANIPIRPTCTAVVQGTAAMQ